MTHVVAMTDGPVHVDMQEMQLFESAFSGMNHAFLHYMKEGHTLEFMKDKLNEFLQLLSVLARKQEGKIQDMVTNSLYGIIPDEEALQLFSMQIRLSIADIMNEKNVIVFNLYDRAARFALGKEQPVSQRKWVKIEAKRASLYRNGSVKLLVDAWTLQDAKDKKIGNEIAEIIGIFTGQGGIDVVVDYRDTVAVQDAYAQRVIEEGREYVKKEMDAYLKAYATHCVC